MRLDPRWLFLPSLLVVVAGSGWNVASRRLEGGGRVMDSVAALVNQDIRLRQLAVGSTWHGLPTEPSAIVESTVVDGDRVAILRVVPVVSHHWPRYSVLRRGDRVARAAGFLRPDLREAWDLLGRNEMTPSILIERSRRLAQLCAAWGGEVLVSGGSQAARFDERLRDLPQSVRGHVLPDTLLRLDEGGTLVRVTTLERSAGMAAQWLPVVWVLEVTDEGSLAEWSRLGAAPPMPFAGE